MREYIEGASLADKKTLQQLRLTQEQAVAMGLAQIHSLVKHIGVIPVDLTDKNILIRKYIRPVRWSASKEPDLPNEAPAVKPDPPKRKAVELHPSYQVVLLSLGNLQPLPSATFEEASKYWAGLKKAKKLPSLSSFREQLSYYK